MVLLLVLAGLLLLASGGLVALAHGHTRRARRLTATPTSTCAELLDEAAAVRASLGSAALARETELKGVGAALDGVFTGPFSGRPVLWYRATVTHHFWRTTTSTDSRGQVSRSRRRASEVLSCEETGQARLLLRDATGDVQVDLSGAEVDHPHVLHDRLEPAAERPGWRLGPLTLGGGRGDDIGHQYVEEALVPGAPLYVCGTAREADAPGGVQLVGGRLLVSTRTEEELVRSSTRTARWFSAGSLVTGAGAVACVVLAVRAGT